VRRLLLILEVMCTRPALELPFRAAGAIALSCAICGAWLAIRTPVRWSAAISQTPRASWRIFFFGAGLAVAGLYFVIGHAVARASRKGGVGASSGRGDGGRQWVRAALCALPYAALGIWFQVIRPWERYFDTASPAVPLYYGLRLLFVGYLLWLIYFLGTQLVDRVLPDTAEHGIENFLLAFFAGLGLTYIAVLLAGMARLFYPWPVFALTAVGVFASSPAFVRLLGRIPRRVQTSFETRSVFELLTIGVLAALLAGAWLLAAAHQGLSITGHGYDASHYVPFFQQAIERHGIYPNDYWYHFYISKGAALAFLATMVTDLQGPQLASLLAFIVTSLVVFALAQEMTSNGPWPYLAACAYSTLAAIHFPFFQKHHIVAACLVAGVAWFTVRAQTRHEPPASGYLLVFGLVVVAAVIHSPIVGVFLLPFLGIVAVGNLLRRQHRLAWSFFLLAGTGGLVAVFLLGFNYSLTGLAEITPFKLFFTRGDQQKFAEWVSPFLILLLEEGSQSSTGQINWGALFAVNMDRLKLLFNLDLLTPVFSSRPLQYLLAVAAPLAAVMLPSLRKRVGRTLLPGLILLLWAFALSQVVDQKGSIERYYTIFFPVTLLVPVAAWIAVAELLRMEWLGPASSRLLRAAAAVQRPLACAVVVLLVLRLAAGQMGPYFDHKNGVQQLSVLGQQLSGQIGFRDALKEYREIDDECVNAQRHVGPGKRILMATFIVPTGCYFMPGGSMALSSSGPGVGDWHTIVFERPERVRQALRRLDIEYLYVDASPQAILLSCEPQSDLFQPDNFRKYLRVAWRQGDIFLLTWRNGHPDESPDDQDFLRRWSQIQGLPNIAALCNRVRGYYREQFGRYPVHTDPSLPKLQGWQ